MKRLIAILLPLFSFQVILFGQSTNELILREAVNFLIKDTLVYKNLQPCNDCADINALIQFYEDEQQPNSAIYVVDFIKGMQQDNIFKSTDYGKLIALIDKKIAQDERAYRKEKYQKEYETYNKNIQSFLPKPNVDTVQNQNPGAIQIGSNPTNSLLTLNNLLYLLCFLTGLFILSNFILTLRLKKLTKKVINLESQRTFKKEGNQQNQDILTKEFTKFDEKLNALQNEILSLKNIDKDNGKKSSQLQDIEKETIVIKKKEEPPKKIFNPIKYYAKKPENGIYNHDNFYTNAQNVQFFIDVTITDEDMGEINLSTESDKVRYSFRGGYKNYLTPDYCEIEGEFVEGQPYKVEKGFIKLENNQWVVTKKIKVKF